LVTSLLASAFGKVIGWSVEMVVQKSNKKLVGLATNKCVKITGGYVASRFMKLPNFSCLPF